MISLLKSRHQRASLPRNLGNCFCCRGDWFREPESVLWFSVPALILHFFLGHIKHVSAAALNPATLWAHSLFLMEKQWTFLESLPATCFFDIAQALPLVFLDSVPPLSGDLAESPRQTSRLSLIMLAKSQIRSRFQLKEHSFLVTSSTSSRQIAARSSLTISFDVHVLGCPPFHPIACLSWNGPSRRVFSSRL